VVLKLFILFILSTNHTDIHSFIPIIHNRLCQIFPLLVPLGPTTGQVNAAGYDVQ